MWNIILLFRGIISIIAYVILIDGDYIPEDNISLSD